MKKISVGLYRKNAIKGWLASTNQPTPCKVRLSGDSTDRPRPLRVSSFALYMQKHLWLADPFWEWEKEGLSLEGEVPDEAGVRVIWRGRAAVRGWYDWLTAVAPVHVPVVLHVVAPVHRGAWGGERERGEMSKRSSDVHCGFVCLVCVCVYF